MRRLTQEEIIESFIKTHGDKYNYSKVKYIDSQTKVEIICPKHGSWFTKIHDHRKGFGCMGCRNEKLSTLKYSLEDILLRCKNIHGEKYDYSKIKEYKGITNIYPFICNKHNELIYTQMHIHLNGDGGCRKCMYEGNSLRNSLNNIDFIKECELIHNGKYDYSKVNYINNSTKVEIICPKHGSFFQKPNGHKDSKQGCPKCKEKKGENKIRLFLEENKISYIFQHSFIDCKDKNKLFFDFYLPDYNICIEYDGEQHFKPIKFFGGDGALESCKRRDEIKNQYCLENNIKLLRIPYYKIKNINKILNKILCQ